MDDDRFDDGSGAWHQPSCRTRGDQPQQRDIVDGVLRTAGAPRCVDATAEQRADTGHRSAS